MVRQRMLVTARQQRLDTRRRALERAEAEVGLSAEQHAANVRAAKQALAKAERAAPKPGDLKEVCRLCSTSVSVNAAAHRCALPASLFCDAPWRPAQPAALGCVYVASCTCRRCTASSLPFAEAPSVAVLPAAAPPTTAPTLGWSAQT